MTGLPLWTGRPAGLSWALTGGGAGRGGQANLEAVDPLVPEAMWAPQDHLETWASRALRESLDHLENKDSGELWDQL